MRDEKMTREDLIQFIFDIRTIPKLSKGIPDEDKELFINRLKKLGFYKKALNMFRKLTESISDLELARIYEVVTDEAYIKYKFVKKEAADRVMGELSYEELEEFDRLVNKFKE